MAKTKFGPKPWREAPKKLRDRLAAYQKSRGLQVDSDPGVQTVDQLLLDGERIPGPPDVPPPPDDWGGEMPAPTPFPLGGWVLVLAVVTVIAVAAAYCTPV